jgi:hypothetical protein
MGRGAELRQHRPTRPNSQARRQPRSHLVQRNCSKGWARRRARRHGVRSPPGPASLPPRHDVFPWAGARNPPPLPAVNRWGGSRRGGCLSHAAGARPFTRSCNGTNPPPGEALSELPRQFRGEWPARVSASSPTRNCQRVCSPVAGGAAKARQLGFERLGSSSCLCQLRAHGEEQNGSPCLKATSGRSLPHHTQRPFGRTGGSAFISCSFSTVASLQRGFEPPYGARRRSLAKAGRRLLRPGVGAHQPARPA